MCQWGDVVYMNLVIPANLSSTGVEKVKNVRIDRCIAPLVNELNKSCNITTIASCCGHGKRPGNIILGDGRELIIAKDHAEGRKIDDIFNKNGYEPIN